MCDHLLSGGVSLPSRYINAFGVVFVQQFTAGKQNINESKNLNPILQKQYRYDDII